MQWFWISFFAFLSALVVSAAVMRPDTVDATLTFVGSFLTVLAWTVLVVMLVAVLCK